MLASHTPAATRPSSTRDISRSTPCDTLTSPSPSSCRYFFFFSAASGYPVLPCTSTTRGFEAQLAKCDLGGRAGNKRRGGVGARDTYLYQSPSHAVLVRRCLPGSPSSQCRDPQLDSRSTVGWLRDHRPFLPESITRYLYKQGLTPLWVLFIVLFYVPAANQNFWSFVYGVSRVIGIDPKLAWHGLQIMFWRSVGAA